MIQHFLSKKDWSAIFFASLLLLFLLGFSLLSKVFAWIVIIILLIVGGFSFYFSFIKKYDKDDYELEEMVSSLKDDWFGGKKK